MFKRWLIVLDGERHRGMRRAFGGEFTPRKAGRYRASIETNANALIDVVLERGAMDLVAEFARPLPFAVICGVLGIPRPQQNWVGELILTLSHGFAHQREVGPVESASVAAAELQAYFGELLDHRRANPRDDLMTRLASELPDDPNARRHPRHCVFFIQAGHATTTSLIAAGTLLLLQTPHQIAALDAAPADITGAVEELLRMIAPTTVVVSRALRDYEIDGCPFYAGQHRWVFLSAANRDQLIFENPDRFDPSRDPNPHLTFSAGKHFCLGAPLARLHGESPREPCSDDSPSSASTARPSGAEASRSASSTASRA